MSLSISFSTLYHHLPPPAVARLATRERKKHPPPSIPYQISKELPQLALSSSSSPAICSQLQCQHFQSCSGCTHEWNMDRPPVVEDISGFFKFHGVSDFTFESGLLWEWRCRAKLVVRGTLEDPLIGLYEEGTHNVVDIPLCRAHHPRINSVVNLLKQGITSLNIFPYNEDEGTGELRYVQMTMTTQNTSLPYAERYQNGRVQVALVWNSRNEKSQSSEKLNSLSNYLWEKAGDKSNLHLVHSVWANFQTSTNNIIFGNRWRHLLGEVDFWQRLGGVDISLAPSSFCQANTQAFDSLLRKIQKYVPYGTSVVDLYAGVGIIGLSVAVTRKCRSVKCVEINKESRLSFQKSLSRLPKNIDSNISWHHADASIDSVHWLEGSDVVIVDPPRKGLNRSLVEALKNTSIAHKKTVSMGRSSLTEVKDEKRPWILRARESTVHIDSKSNWEMTQSWPHTLIYISCGWESFKEDCKMLLSCQAWHLEKAHAFNFFPGTQRLKIKLIYSKAAM